MQTPVTIQITNLRNNFIVGEITYDGTSIQTDAKTLEPLIAFYKEQKLSDEQIIVKLSGWSNTVEAAQVVEGSI